MFVLVCIAGESSEVQRELDQLKINYNHLQESYDAVKRELKDAQEKNRRLEEELRKTKFGYEFVKDSDEKVKFFTGLQTLQVFLWLLQIVKRNPVTLRGGLSWGDHLLLVLMKIRLGLTNRDIAYRFRLSFGSVSGILRSWLPLLSAIMRPLISWPTKDVIRSKLPKSFKRKFKRCVCIIDCTEIFIQRPYNVKVRAQTWSTYKSQNTMKYLIGITPSGSISYLSQGWGGRASDKVITLESDFLSKLEHGDEVLADRGFLIQEELAAVGATLRIPSFTKGKTQLSGGEVDRSRQLSRVRIHVERVIGALKMCRILSTAIPISQVDLIDHFVTVCAGITNLRGAIVPR